VPKDEDFMMMRVLQPVDEAAEVFNTYGKDFHTSTGTVLVTETLQPLNLSHKKCSGLAGKWTSVCP
jgi:hypothetical protein